MSRFVGGAASSKLLGQERRVGGHAAPCGNILTTALQPSEGRDLNLQAECELRTLVAGAGDVLLQRLSALDSWTGIRSMGAGNPWTRRGMQSITKCSSNDRLFFLAEKSVARPCGKGGYKGNVPVPKAPVCRGDAPAKPQATFDLRGGKRGAQHSWLPHARWRSTRRDGQNGKSIRGKRGKCKGKKGW